uniref:Uncharacterized protein n=1 Tax=Anguilla anguilla TaxID=7936 RepID=A0A0E9W1J1_ANGAN
MSRQPQDTTYTLITSKTPAPQEGRYVHLFKNHIRSIPVQVI